MDELAQLVVGARAGDPSSWARLLERVRARVYRWALVRTGDADEADDVAQEVSISVHRNLGRFDGRSRFTTWLYRISANALADRGRRLHRRILLREALAREEGGRALESAVLERIGDADARALVQTFFAELPARQREAFELRDLQGLSGAEVAEIMGVDVATARVHLLRARRTLRARLIERGITRPGEVG